MKRLISLLMVLAMLFSLAACKRKENMVIDPNASIDVVSEEDIIEGSAEDVEDEDVVVSTASSANSVSISSKPSTSSKPAETASKPVTSKASETSKTASVSKNNTTSKEAVTSKAPVASKNSTTSKAPVASKNSTTSKAPVVSKDTTNSKVNSVAAVVSTVSSLEDFGDKLEESGFETNIKENEDGSITIGLKPSTPDKKEEETLKPVIPVIPSIDDIEEDEEPEIPVETPVTSSESVASETSPEVSTPAGGSSADEAVSTPAPSTSVPSVTPPQKVYYSYTTNQTHTALKNTQSYLYSILTEEQKGWYRKIDAAINNLDTEVFLNADLMTNENYNIYFLYLLDNPEHFYLSNELSIFGMSDKPNQHGLEFYYAVGTKEGEFSDETHPLTDGLKQKIRSKKATFEAKVEEIISTIPSAAPAVEKEKLIYDKILINSVYNVEAALDHPTQGMADDWTAYGVLVNGTGVCESYDEAFQYLLRRVGIRSTAIVGTANGGGHKWCEVEIEGNWYMCDITFDDPVGGAANAAYHRYFNLTSGEMASKDKHDWSTNTYKLPPCNASEYSYKNYFKN